jgi:nucleotide-binding universal stress UspA family protein
MVKQKQRTNYKNIPKTHIRKILIPLDGSKNSNKSLLTAIHLAVEHDASLTAVHVITHSEKKYKQSDLEDVPPSFIIQAKKLAMENKIPFDNRILLGDPGHSIVEYADTHSVDLIVIGARGLSTFKKIFLGSVSHYVMQKADMPIVLVK